VRRERWFVAPATHIVPACELAAFVLSISPGETAITAAEHVQRHADFWRMSDDFWDNWGEPRLVDEHGHESSLTTPSAQTSISWVGLPIVVAAAELGFESVLRVRDLWLGHDLGEMVSALLRACPFTALACIACAR